MALATDPTHPPPSQWPHIDLCPSRVGFHCAQGIVNLNDNGPDDGGLVVMKGSSRLMKAFFDEHGRPPVPLEGKIDWNMFTEDQKQWFFDRGCTWHKGELICALFGSCARDVVNFVSCRSSVGSLRRPRRPDPVAQRYHAPGQTNVHVQSPETYDLLTGVYAINRVCLPLPPLQPLA